MGMCMYVFMYQNNVPKVILLKKIWLYSYLRIKMFIRSFLRLATWYIGWWWASRYYKINHEMSQKWWYGD